MRFLIWFCIFEAMAATPWAHQAVGACARIDTRLAATLLHWLGQSVQVRDSTVASTRFAIAVFPECTASEMVWFLAAAVCAFRTTWWRKLAGVGFAVFTVAAVNACRIVSVFLVGAYRPAWFDTVHEEIWAGLNILAVVAIALVWVGWVRSGARENAAAVLENRTRHPQVRFFIQFAIVFSVGFAAAWLGIAQPTGACFRTIGTLVFSSQTGPREVDFERQSDRETNIVIVNRALMNADGSGPVRNLNVKTRNFVWWPLCFYVALVSASPLSRRQRVWSLASGVLIMLGMMMLLLNFTIWDNSTEVALVWLSPFWKGVVETLNINLQAFFGQGAPFLLWVLFGFRRVGFI